MHHEHGCHPERHIDEKDDPPADLVSQDSAQQRPRHRREHHRHRQIPHVTPPHSRRYQVAHDDHRQSDQSACAHPLESSQQHQLPHLGHEPRQPREDDEDDCCHLVGELAAIDVAELAVDRRDHRERHQIRSHDPGDLIHSSEVAHDSRDSHIQDAGVQSGEEHPRDDCHQDDSQLALSETDFLKPFLYELSFGRRRFWLAGSHAVA